MKNCSNYDSFEERYLKILENHAPIKQKTLRRNQTPYMTKQLRKAIMKRTELCSKYCKLKTDESLHAFKKQRNFCSRLYKKERKRYYGNLSLSKITDSKKFWNTVKPFLTDKGSSSSKITLVKGSTILSDPKEVSAQFSNYYQNAVKSLGISRDVFATEDVTGITDPVLSSVAKYSKHPSILAIKKSLPSIEGQKFEFNIIEQDDVEKEVRDLNSRKKGTFCNITPSEVKELPEIWLPVLNDTWNKELVNQCNFPNKLKLADITPVYKKDDATQDKNYRPVSVLPTVSKVFERLMQQQIQKYMDAHLSKYLCGYRRGYSTQTALSIFVEKWKEVLDKKGFAAAMLMDLSKAFDTIDHDLLIAKLSAYGFGYDSLKLIHSYLSNRWQRVKIETAFSKWTELDEGVPQGSVLGPLLFNIYLNDIFLALEGADVCNFADDTTPYICGQSLSDVLTKLEMFSEKALNWFELNFLKLNPEKCHLLVSGFKHEVSFAKLDDNVIWEDAFVKLLGVNFDRDLKFDTHISNICSTANKKLNALMRLSKVLTFDQKRTLFKSFFESQFNNCPLVWMLHSRKSEKKVNALHERALRFLYEDYTSSFENILEKDQSYTIHDRNIQNLAIEIYKFLHNIRSVFDDIFSCSSLNHRSEREILVPSINTVTYGENSLRYFGPLIWNIVPHEFKQSASLKDFKTSVKSWKPQPCPCRCCKEYVADVGFIKTFE